MDSTSRSMSIPALAECCKRELDKYRRGEASDDQYGLELFSRSLLERNSFAWEVVQQCFNAMVLGWIRDHRLRDMACRHDSEENFVAQAFSRFWQATADNKEIKFQTLGAALKYLRASLHGVIIDTLRSYSRARVTTLLEYEDTSGPRTQDHYDSGELWQVISRLLPNARERRVAYLLYHCGLKPREIVRFCRQEFDDVHEIYLIRRNIIGRLRRNADVIRWCIGSEIEGE
jgi:DNA-directed RNA polymerase specialized sigma24 family protein